MTQLHENTVAEEITLTGEGGVVDDVLRPITSGFGSCKQDEMLLFSVRRIDGGRSLRMYRGEKPLDLEKSRLVCGVLRQEKIAIWPATVVYNTGSIIKLALDGVEEPAVFTYSGLDGELVEIQ